HSVLGHRGSPGLGKSFQENSAVAFFVYLVGRARRLTPDLHHTKGHNFPLITKRSAMSVNLPLERNSLH
ncbi:hypothetical protein, partial [Candidatus Aeolococcus gillhamiae]|uniref:hypothetical protein n=1 Tax=Candidatus Aeolococcus gillhamiae TaxID=3127015 RepID=UPI0030780D37